MAIAHLAFGPGELKSTKTMSTNNGLQRKSKTGDHHLKPGVNRKRTSSCSNSVTLAMNLILNQERGTKRQTEHIHGHS
jgi:hypothetical protein